MGSLREAGEEGYPRRGGGEDEQLQKLAKFSNNV